MAKTQKKGQATKVQKTVAKKISTAYNYSIFKLKHAQKPLVCAILLLILLLISQFKNISHPLFWGDEGATALGTERVLKFGYPKVHDGKNVFQFQQPIGENLLIDKNTDAYLGEGPNWVMYYYGAIGYTLTEKTENLYTKTGIYRSTYALLGILGLLILGISMSRFFDDKFDKYTFISLFLLFELTSISVVLHLKEVRGYPITMFLSLSLVSMYLTFRFLKPYNKIIYISGLVILLFLLFNSFLPAYMILLLSFGLSELVIMSYTYITTRNIKNAITSSIVPMIPLVVSVITIYPILLYFKTFEASAALSKFFGYNSDIYWANIASILRYFRDFEPFWLAIGLKLLLLLNTKNLLKKTPNALKVSCYLSLLFILFVLTVSRIPYQVFTRYFITLQPFFSVMIIFDLFILVKLYSQNSLELINTKVGMILLFSFAMFGYNFYKNLPDIKGHIYELTHEFQGPLDYTIPYIKSTFKRTDTLLIAANDEETSYEYYLGSKMILSYNDMNLAKDSTLQPDIIAFRKSLGSPIFHVYNSMLQRRPYTTISFPIQDVFVNNLPELNYSNSAIHHKYETILPPDEQNKTILFILSSLINTEKK